LKDRRFETWDIQRSPSDVGRIAETFRLRPGTQRSNHPTHSVCARGAMADELTRGHQSGRERPGPWGGYAFGHNSPWQKLYVHNAEIVLLGTDMKTSTLVHLIEHMIAGEVLEHLSQDRADVFARRLSGWLKPGVWPVYDRMALQAEMEARGMLRYTACGNCRIIAYKTKDMVDLALTLMRRNPECWFPSEYMAWHRSVMDTMSL